MKIDVGDEAPLFTAPSVNKGTVSLAGLRGRKVLLVFGRYFGCPICQHDFDRLLGMLDEQGLSIQIIYVTQSSPENTLEYINELEVDFPVISVSKQDGKYPLYSDYGVGKLRFKALLRLLGRSREARAAGKVHGEYEGSELQSPADFVIDEEGRVIWAHLGFLEPEEIIRVLS